MGVAMRKLLILPALLIGSAPTVTFAQMRGGPPVQTNTPDNGNSPVSTNPMDQYLQRKSLQDLTDSQRAAVSKLGPARAAKADELIAGAVVNDKTGAPMSKIVEVDADGVVVSMGIAKVKVPAQAFGHNKAGLLLDMTKAQFEQVVAQAK
jgi:hypothetical protein